MTYLTKLQEALKILYNELSGCIFSYTLSEVSLKEFLEKEPDMYSIKDLGQISMKRKIVFLSFYRLN